VELIHLEVLLRRFRFLLTWSEADVVPCGRRNEAKCRVYYVAAAVFDDVVSALRRASEAGKPGFPAGMDLGRGSKIQILEDVDCRENSPGGH